MDRMQRFSSVLVLGCLVCLLSAPALAGTRSAVDEAVQRMQQGRFQSALTILHDVEQRLANPRRLADLIGTAYIGLGYQHLQNKQFEQSLQAFEAGRDYAEDSVDLWLGEAVARYRLGQYDQAEHAAQMGMAIDDREAKVYLVLGQIYYAQGYLYDAMVVLEEGADLDQSASIQPLLDKVRREWDIEQDMERDQVGMFQISFADDAQGDLAVAILDELNAAYSDLGSQLGYYPDVVVPVLLYSRQDFTAVSRSPDWAGAVYDGKIRIPLGGVRRMSAQLAALLYHEYAHVLLHYLGRGQIPVWLNEGFAELAGRIRYDRALEHLGRAHRQNQLIDWTVLEQPFAELPRASVPLAYEQSYGMTSFLVNQFGWMALRDLFDWLGEGVGFDEAVRRAYGQFGLDWEGLQSEWRTAMRHQG